MRAPLAPVKLRLPIGDRALRFHAAAELLAASLTHVKQRGVRDRLGQSRRRGITEQMGKRGIDVEKATVRQRLVDAFQRILEDRAIAGFHVDEQIVTRRQAGGKFVVWQRGRHRIVLKSNSRAIAARPGREQPLYPRNKQRKKWVIARKTNEPKPEPRTPATGCNNPNHPLLSRFAARLEATRKGKGACPPRYTSQSCLSARESSRRPTSASVCVRYTLQAVSAC